MSRPSITADLREFVNFLHERKIIPAIDRGILTDIADQIDTEHECRMRQQSYDLRKAFCRYVGGVVEDYKHGVKRKRVGK